MNRPINIYDQLRVELNKLLDHPTFQFLQAEAQYYEYILEQQPKNQYAFQVGNRVFYSVEYFNSTVEDFLEIVLLPCFAEFGTERIAQKRINGPGNAATARTQFKKMLEALSTLEPRLFHTEPSTGPYVDQNVEPILCYEESDQRTILWHAYDTLENYALALDNAKFIRTHHGLNCKFKIFIDEKQPFVFAANSGDDLIQCYYFLNFIEFHELVKDNYLQAAKELAEKHLGSYLSLTPGITTRFDFSERSVYCLMESKNSFSFNKYTFKCRDLAQLISDVNNFRHQHKLYEKTNNDPYIRTSNDNVLIANTDLADKAMLTEYDKVKYCHFT